MKGRGHFLIFLPGMMGTTLRYVRESPDLGRQNYPVWNEQAPVLLNTLAKDPQSLQRELEVGHVLREVRVARWFGPVHQCYGPLLNHLTDERGRLRYRDGIDFTAFGYDWRKSNRSTAGVLGGFMRTKLAEGVRCFRIVAHSMGALVARLLLCDHRDLAERTELVVQIAPPVLGSPRAYFSLKVFPELHSLVTFLFNIMSAHNLTLHDRLMETIRQFDSMYELLPPDSEQILIRTSGERFSAVAREVWLPIYHPKLDLARNVHTFVQDSGFTPTVTFYGSDVLTEHEYLIDQDYNVLRRIKNFIKGDGTVIVKSAVHDTPVERRRPVPGGHVTHDWLAREPIVLGGVEQVLLQ